MKKLLTIAIVLIIVVSLVTFETILINTTVSEFSSLTEDIQSNYLAGEDVSNELRSMTERWMKRRNYLYVFLIHSSILKIDNQLYSLEVLVESTSVADTLIAFNLLSHFFDEMKQSYNFSITNIF